MHASSLGRQFQPTLPNMEHLAPALESRRTIGRPRTSETVHKVITQATDKPAGMRGSIPDRAAMSDRMGRKAQNRKRWDSLRTRIDDERHTEYAEAEDDDTPIPKHPKTGLPTYGEASTHDDVGMSRSSLPVGLSYHGSAASARNKVSKSEMIPLYNMQQPYSKQMIGTTQDAISSRRTHEAMEHPETTQSPRFHGPGMEELPHVYKQSAGSRGDLHTVIDGNHRTAGHILQGRLFMQARTLTDADIPEVSKRTRKTQRATTQALEKPGHAERHEKRHSDLLFGTGNW